MRRLLSVFALVLVGCGWTAAGNAQPAPDASVSLGLPALRLFDVARGIELDDSEGEALGVLRAATWLTVDDPQNLPNGLSRVIIAVPQDGDCLPRGAALICSSIRVVMVNDPVRGPRVSRVEAFELLSGEESVVQLFRNAASGLGPPLQTESWSDQIRGMPRSVWRQRWRPDAQENTYIEVVVTSQQGPDEIEGLPNPSSRALGIGFLLVDPVIEDSTLMARRRLICPPGRADCR